MSGTKHSSLIEIRREFVPDLRRQAAALLLVLGFRIDGRPMERLSEREGEHRLGTPDEGVRSA